MREKSSTTPRSSERGRTLRKQDRTAGERALNRASAHDVVSALQAEHRYAARLLDVLEESVATVSDSQPLDRDALRAGMTYMTQHLDGYHHRREDALFAQLVRRDPHLAKSITKVKREHRSIGAAGEELLAALEQSSRSSRRNEAGVISGVNDYVKAMRAHMALEEGEIFPRARQLLDEHEFAEIDQAFTRVIDPIFEASMRDAYSTYSPVIRYLVERSATQQALGALDSLLDSALTLGETLFGGVVPGRHTSARAPNRR